MIWPRVPIPLVAALKPERALAHGTGSVALQQWRPSQDLHPCWPCRPRRDSTPCRASPSRTRKLGPSMTASFLRTLPLRPSMTASLFAHRRSVCLAGLGCGQPFHRRQQAALLRRDARALQAWRQRRRHTGPACLRGGGAGVCCRLPRTVTVGHHQRRERRGKDGDDKDTPHLPHISRR
jgi:hypothetical protein